MRRPVRRRETCLRIDFFGHVQCLTNRPSGPDEPGGRGGHGEPWWIKGLIRKLVPIRGLCMGEASKGVGFIEL
jgi:hypothetical protein